MKNSKIGDIVLWGLVLFGFAGALKVSYENFTGSPCPYLATIPICYIVLAAYGSMIAAMLISRHVFKHYLFCMGWGTAFLIALAGSAAEIMAGGGVCPTSGGGGVRGAANGSSSIPLCYISLAMTIVILILFLMGPYKRSCDKCNAAKQKLSQ